MKSCSPRPRASNIALRSVTEIVEPRTASEASSDTTPQKAS